MALFSRKIGFYVPKPLGDRGSFYTSLALTLLLSTAGISALTISKNWLRQESAVKGAPESDEPLYLPQVEYVKLITLGFDNFAADILWFNTINYFGKQFRDGKRDYRWLYQMCDLVTALDPQRGVEYEFCSNMIAWEAKDFAKSQLLLERAIAAQPNHWRYRYLHGFNAWYFLQDKETARRDLEQAAKLPDAPKFVASLASRLIADTDSAQTAIAFLTELLRNSKDENEKAALKTNIQRAQMTLHIQTINAAIAQFKSQYSESFESLDQLVAKGLLKQIPADPFGGKYVWVKDWNEVASTSGERPLEFHGRDKNSGIFSAENGSK